MNASPAAAHDIVVVGASAGGVEALCELVAGLPPDYTASVFVVLHIPPGAQSELATILGSSSPLPVVKANTDQEVKPGWIYVAPANQHLILTEGPVLLWRGPKEDRFRPSINVLFRSAAAAYGRRVVGIVLSGYSHDGTAGLWWIKRSGGIAMVRFPDDAAVPDMPQSALEYVEVDYVLPASKMGGVLGRLAAPRARIRGALSGKA